MSWENHLELVTLRDVFMSLRRKYDRVSPDYDYRKICREYSKTFATPLHEVYLLPMEDVVRAYLEEAYEGYSEDELLHEIENATRDERKAEAAKREEDAVDVQAWKDEQYEIRMEAAAKKLEGDVNQFVRLAKKTLVGNHKVQPGIAMRFADEDDDPPPLPDGPPMDLGILDDPSDP